MNLKKIYSKDFDLPIHAAIFTTIVTVVVFELIGNLNNSDMLNYICFFTIIVGFNSFYCGVNAGLLTSLVFVCYILYLTGISFDIEVVSGNRETILMVNLFIFVIISVFVGFMKEGLKNKFKLLEQGREEIEKAESMLPIMIAHGGLDGKIVKVPRDFCTLLGYSEDELLSSSFFEITHKDDIELQRNLYDKLLSNKLPYMSIEKRYIKKTGDYVWVSVNTSIVKDNNGNPKYLLGYVMDISKRKKAEKALIESEKKFREIFNNTNDAIFLHEYKDSNKPGRFIEVNERVIEWLDYSREEILSMTPVDLSAETHKDIPNRLVEDLLYKDFDIFETVLHKKNGEIVYTEIYAHAFILNGERVLLSIARDITERKRAEEELKMSEEKYRNLVELSPDAIYVHIDGIIQYANPATARIFGVLDAASLIGKDASDYLIIHNKYLAEALDRKHKMEKGEKDLPLKFVQFTRYDGVVVDLETLTIPIIMDGKLAVQVIARDVSDRSRAEEMRKKAQKEMELYSEIVQYDKLKTEFFANVSHEIRTPLNIILTSLQMMNIYLKNICIKDDQEKLLKYTGLIKQNSYRLMRLVNNLIDITKIDSGYFVLEMRNVEIVSTIENIVLSVADFVESKGVLLQFDTNEEEKFMACDPDKIERIMLNLLSNAVKYTKNGDSILVDVFVTDGEVKISVKDTGIGIPKDKQHIVFERFRQVERLLSRPAEGSGIGLSLVKHLVELHGGNISLISEVGVGSEFIIVLPALIIDEESNIYESKNYDTHESIEKINIEFSDIYS